MPLINTLIAADAIGIKTPSNIKSLYYIYNIQEEYRQSYYYIPYTKYSLSLLPIRTEL